MMPTDIITYRYNKKLVYVPVAPTYIQALSHARDAFPELKGLCDTSLSLSLAAPTRGYPDTNASNFVGISAPAWPKLITHMSRYQIIDVHVLHGDAPIPDITITCADANTDPAPPYRSSGLDVPDNEKASYSASRSSAPTLHSKRNWLLQKLHGQ